MTQFTATVATQSASRYLQQLCKHWSHKFDVTFDAHHGQVPLPMGLVVLTAQGDALIVRITIAEGGDAARLQNVVAEHLNRFAFREGELIFDWVLDGD